MSLLNIGRTLRLAHKNLSVASKWVRNFGAQIQKTAEISDRRAERKKKQIFEYFLVVDFEATCDWKIQPQPQEIIEFPCLKLNSESLEVESVFHRYVRPTAHPELSDFCTELTGIVQEMIDNQSNLEATLDNFDQWLKAENLLASAENGKWENPNKFAFVTMGEWDLKRMLTRECQFLGLKPREYFHEWINLKKMVFDYTKIWPRGMVHMLEILNLKHQGRLHSGIDDCKTLVEVIKFLADNGVVMRITTKIDN